jgi:hypothetical protein
MLLREITKSICSAMTVSNNAQTSSATCAVTHARAALIAGPTAISMGCASGSSIS